MSTRCSIASVSEDGSSLHVYSDCFDEDDTAYIETISTGDACTHSITVALSGDAWRKFAYEVADSVEAPTIERMKTALNEIADTAYGLCPKCCGAGTPYPERGAHEPFVKCAHCGGTGEALTEDYDRLRDIALAALPAK